MFEAATAAFAHLSAAAASASYRSALAAVSIAAPLPLSPRGEALLELSLNPGSGTLAAYSMNLVSVDRQLHLRTCAAHCRSGSSATAAAEHATYQSSAQQSRWAGVVLREAVADLVRFDGGTLACLDTRQDQPGSG